MVDMLREGIYDQNPDVVHLNASHTEEARTIIRGLTDQGWSLSEIIQLGRLLSRPSLWDRLWDNLILSIPPERE